MKDGLIINSFGNKYWCKNNRIHREDGPAVENNLGDKEWYKEGKSHREDGPAIELSNGNKYWFYEGEEIECLSTKEFLQIIKLRIFK